MSTSSSTAGSGGGASFFAAGFLSSFFYSFLSALPAVGATGADEGAAELPPATERKLSTGLLARVLAKRSTQIFSVLRPAASRTDWSVWALTLAPASERMNAAYERES